VEGRVEKSDYPTCQRTYATLRVYPKRYGPEAVTARLGLEPSGWQRCGAAKIPGSRPAPLHGWFLSSDEMVASRDVRRHLDWLLSRIASRGDAIRALQAEGCDMDVSCFWVSTSGHGGPSVRPAQMEELARLNLELSFDVYLGGDDE
jgi:Domain of unknown function (DUF4279)